MFNMIKQNNVFEQNNVNDNVNQFGSEVKTNTTVTFCEI